MSLNQLIKKLNQGTSGNMVGSDDYFRKSPSNILLKQAIEPALKKYALHKHVVDAGAGRLAYKPLITRYAKSYTSFDFAQTHLELDTVTNIENMSFKDHEFEVVFCSQVLEHVPHPWIAFREIHRVLKPKGTAIITVPMLGYVHNAPHDYYRYTTYGLESLATDAGFKIIKVKPLGGFFCFLGYIRSTVLMLLFGLPFLGKIILFINYVFSQLDIWLDKLTKNDSLFPLNYILIIKKK